MRGVRRMNGYLGGRSLALAGAYRSAAKRSATENQRFFHILVHAPGHEKLLVRLFSRLVRGRSGGDVLHELTAAFLAFVFNHAHAARGDVAGFGAEDASLAYLNVGAKPIGAEHSSGAIEGDRKSVV